MAIPTRANRRAQLILCFCVLLPACQRQQAVPSGKDEMDIRAGCGSNLNPEAVELQKKAIDSIRVLGRTAEAASLLEKAIAIEPRLIGAYVQLGTWYSLGRHDQAKAVAVLTKAVAACPDSDELHGALASSYAANGQNAEAVRQFEESMRLGSRTPSALYNLGNSYAQLKQLDKAIESYREAVKLDPQHLEARRSLVIACIEKGDKESARAAALELEKRDPVGEMGNWARDAIRQLK
jgi:tetratricopeptide (TPR) repeat protein